MSTLHGIICLFIGINSLHGFSCIACIDTDSLHGISCLYHLHGPQSAAVIRSIVMLQVYMVKK